jgi:hypothetical protein
MSARPIAFLAAVLLSIAGCAPDATPGSTPASAPARTPVPAPAPASAAAPVGISVTATDALKAATGKEVTVIGEVSRIAPSPTGSLTFINFKELQRGDFSAIIKKENKEAVDKGFDGDVAKALKGKTVELTGTMLDYQGRPEIEISRPEQIKIVAKAEAAASEPAATLPAKN